MVPGFPAELADHAGNILLVWTFVNTFASSLGVHPTLPSINVCMADMIDASMSTPAHHLHTVLSADL